MGSESTLALARRSDLGRAWRGRVAVRSVSPSMVTTTLKSLASSVPVVDCDVATPVERSSA